MLPEDFKFKTTFWQDFSIADRFGYDAIEDTFKRAFAEWKDNPEYLTELVIVLNWKAGEHYDEKDGDNTIANLYDRLWEEADNYAVENLKGEDADYFYEMTD